MSSFITQNAGSDHNRSIALLVGIVGVVASMHLFSVIGLQPPSLDENRALAQAPSLPANLTQLHQLPKNLEAYISDHFPPRAHMIAWLNRARYALGYSSLPKVLVGREGWLFYDDGTAFSYHRGLARPSGAEISAWADALDKRKKWLSAKGIHFYILFAPLKETIYSDKMPKWLPGGLVKGVDDLLHAGADVGLTELIYPKAELLSASRRLLMYSPHDTHWNGYGAYVAYSALLNRIHADLPDIAPLARDAFHESTLPQWAVARDLAVMLGIADMIPHYHPSFVTVDQLKLTQDHTTFLGERRDWTAPHIIETDAPGDRSLLLIRDSFSIQLLPLLRRHFHRIILSHVQDGPTRPELVEKYHPDVVILEIIERSALFAMLPY